jgi:hypothetical protein
LNRCIPAVRAFPPISVRVAAKGTVAPGAKSAKSTTMTTTSIVPSDFAPITCVIAPNGSRLRPHVAPTALYDSGTLFTVPAIVPLPVANGSGAPSVPHVV